MTGPVYDGYNSPALAGLAPFARAQVVQALNVRILIELLNLLGGDVTLEAGFPKRTAIRDIVVMTHANEDGSYRIYLADAPAEVSDFVAIGQRWSRVETRVHDDDIPDVYEVEDVDDIYATMRRVEKGGEPKVSISVVSIRLATLRKRSGWVPWTPPPEMVTEAIGRHLS